MKERYSSTLHRGLLIFLILVAASSATLASATITIQNNDPAGMGFNDPTPVSPVGGNTGTTLGQQRLIAFQFAANIWGATINSVPTITVRAGWSSMPCTADTGTLGSAGTIGIRGNFPNAPFANTWYSSALANALAGTDLNVNPEINATFNSQIGTPGCLQDSGWYLGLDGNHGTKVNLVTVLLHELSHGLGFQSFTDETTGAQPSNFPTIYDKFLRDNSTSKTWDQMTNAERAASAINTGNLVWSGANVIMDVPNVLSGPAQLRVNSPSSIAGTYTVGTADFGPSVSSPGVTADVVRAVDPADPAGPTTTDGCSPFTNAGAVAGKIAFIDRGTCSFVEKVKNAQDAGTAAVIIGNVSDSLNPTIPPQMGIAPGMEGIANTIVIPAISLNLADANTLRGQLGAGINASISRDNTALSGADGAGRPFMFAPNPVDDGSSISHFDRSAFPNQLMEPSISRDLTHNVVPPFDLTFSLLRDLGWTGAAGANPIDNSSFFVRQHYLDFLNREPDAAGLAFWVGEIENCTPKPQCIEVKRINVSAAFFLSIEFQETGFLVYRMYKAAYGDTTSPNVAIPVPIIRFNEFLPDAQRVAQGVQVGIGDWQGQLEANKTAYAREFVVRQRFLTAYPLTLTAAEFVNQLNMRAGNVLSAAERDQLIAELNATGDMTVGRASVLRKVAEDADLRQQETTRAFVLMQYYGYLRRNPDDPPDADFRGWEFWLNKLNQFNGNFVDAEMVKAFILSIEYRQRFGQ
jgi:PA domain/Domain of unknown function (DUF4214)